MARAALLALLLSGCAVTRDCYVGFTVLPLGPFIGCGMTITPPDKDEEPLSV